MEEAYFPIINCQEHFEMYEQQDMAIKLQHKKFHDMIIIELMALCQVLHGLTDTGELPKYVDDKGATSILNKHLANSKKAIISNNQRMVIAGMMKRMLNQLPVRLPGFENKYNDLTAQISNLFLMMKKETSVRSAFGNSFDIDLSQTHGMIQDTVEKIMTLVLEYDAHCEQMEQDLNLKPGAEVAVHNLVQEKLNAKVMKLMQGNIAMKMLGNKVKTAKRQYTDDSYDGSGYESPNVNKK